MTYGLRPYDSTFPTSEDIEKIRHLSESGLKVPMISKALGISDGHLYDLIRTDRRVRMAYNSGKVHDYLTTCERARQLSRQDDDLGVAAKLTVHLDTQNNPQTGVGTRYDDLSAEDLRALIEYLQSIEQKRLENDN